MMVVVVLMVNNTLCGNGKKQFLVAVMQKCWLVFCCASVGWLVGSYVRLFGFQSSKKIS